MPPRPLICMTVRGKPFDESRRELTIAPFEWITNAYSSGIVRVGGVPYLLSNECQEEEVARVLDLADGLFLTGGEDMAPAHFGEEPAVDNLTINEIRDHVELAAVAVADRVGMPILGVCRGIQVLNVARGGSIFQDLARQYPGAQRDHSRGPSRATVQTHDVELTCGSRLVGMMETERLEIATDHHQAVKELGRDLAVVARATEDGVIEAVEGSGERFVVAVQWHPEVRPEDDATLRLFTGFVEGAARFAAARLSPATKRRTGSRK